MTKWFFAVLLWVVVTPAQAHDFHVRDVVIGHPYAVVMEAGQTSTVGYLHFQNTSDVLERLESIETDIGTVTLFDPSLNGGAGGPVQGPLDLPPDEVIHLIPGGLHLRFTDLKAPLGYRDQFVVTFTFQNAGVMGLEFWVQDAP